MALARTIKRFRGICDVHHVWMSVLAKCFACFITIQANSAASWAQSNTLEATASQSNQFRFAAASESALGLWEGEQLVLAYQYGDSDPDRSKTVGSRSSYIHPIIGLDGEVLTQDFPPHDHPYHRGLFWAWPHVSIDGNERNLWTIDGIECKFVRWLSRAVAKSTATLRIQNGWFVEDSKVINEVVRLQVHTVEKNARRIDLEFRWTPTKDQVALRGAEGKGYGGLTIRFAPRTRTIITVPSGRTTEDLLDTKLPWVDFCGDFRNDGKLSGIAILIDPRHPNFPPTWMARHYGLLAVGWPGTDERILAAGETVVCRYRLLIHRSELTAAELSVIYKNFRAEFEDLPKG